MKKEFRNFNKNVIFREIIIINFRNIISKKNVKSK